MHIDLRFALLPLMQTRDLTTLRDAIGTLGLRERRDGDVIIPAEGFSTLAIAARCAIGTPAFLRLPVWPLPVQIVNPTAFEQMRLPIFAQFTRTRSGQDAVGVLRELRTGEKRKTPITLCGEFMSKNWSNLLSARTMAGNCIEFRRRYMVIAAPCQQTIVEEEAVFRLSAMHDQLQAFINEASNPIGYFQCEESLAEAMTILQETNSRVRHWIARDQQLVSRPS